MTRRVSAKQLPLFEVDEVKAIDLVTDADREERTRLKSVQQRDDEARHERWQTHNGGGFNMRPCPCSKCVKARRQAARAR